MTISNELLMAVAQKLAGQIEENIKMIFDDQWGNPLTFTQRCNIIQEVYVNCIASFASQLSEPEKMADSIKAGIDHCLPRYIAIMHRGSANVSH